MVLLFGCYEEPDRERMLEERIRQAEEQRTNEMQRRIPLEERLGRGS